MYFIITCRSLIWGICSIGTLMLTLSAIASPNWLSGKVETVNILNHTVQYRDSLGLYNRCGFRKFHRTYENRCYIYARTFSGIAHASWQACIVFLGMSILLLGIASIFGVLSFCKQLIARKSLVNLAGTLQAFAGILLIIVAVIYPVGWTSERVKRLCHDKYDVSKPYSIGQCSIGSAYYCTIGATLATFLCSLFSFVADKAVFADKVQDEILEGKQIICTL